MLDRDQLNNMEAVAEAMCVLKNSDLDQTIQLLVQEVRELRARVARLESRPDQKKETQTRTVDRTGAVCLRLRR